VARVVRRLQLWRDRYRYEVKRPVLGNAGVAARLVPDAGVDVTAPGGFAALLQRHLAVTPQAPVWERRGGVEVAGEVDWHLEPHFGVRWPSRLETSITDKLPGSDVVLLWHKNKMMPLLDLPASTRIPAMRSTRRPGISWSIRGACRTRTGWGRIGAAPWRSGRGWWCGVCRWGCCARRDRRRKRFASA